MTQHFKNGDLKTTLERSLGFELRPLERLGGSVALNFKAVRKSDGFTFAVKCLSKSKRRNYDNIVARLGLLSDVNGVRRIFAHECPPSFHDFDLLCQSWCVGEHVFPDRFTDAQLAAFLDDYERFSAAMQKVTDAEAPRTILAYREEVLVKSRGLFGGALRRRVESLPIEDCDYRPELLKVTHSDFHHGNVVMADGRVAGFLDLEGFRLGYPADDIVRYFTCAAEHLRWYEQSRKYRMLEKFALAVRHLPYSRHEWRTAVNARFILKAYKHIRKAKSVGIASALNLVWCAGFYARMREVVESGFAGHDAG